MARDYDFEVGRARRMQQYKAKDNLVDEIDLLYDLDTKIASMQDEVLACRERIARMYGKRERSHLIISRQHPGIGYTVIYSCNDVIQYTAHPIMQ